MPEFMILLLANEAEDDRLPPPEMKDLVEGHSAYESSLRAAGAFLDGERLRPSSEGRRVRMRDGKPHIEVGPFSGTALGGYYLVRADNLAAATALAARCPRSPTMSLDVRPVMGSHVRPAKASERGHVFAFAVLGTAATEQGWIEVMDRIDVETRDGFPGERMLGGLRLHAPGHGRRVAATAVFDGPFLESKEVIGGLFFMRMDTLEEAVHWAIQTPFVIHGALEIRELWRT
jgi:hypothetical protein